LQLQLQNILSQADHSLFSKLKKMDAAGIYILKLPEYLNFKNAASKLKNGTIGTLTDLFQRKTQADPIRRPLAITNLSHNVEENRLRSECRLPSGDRYTGYWRVVNGRYVTREGWGRCQYARGGTYEGGWSKGKRHGYGVRRLPDGGKYSGDWKDDKKDGKGKETFKDGSKYDGYWKDNNRSAYGRITYPDGSEYMGDWKDDYRHGDGGTKIWADGQTRYTGSWVRGKRSGRGTMKWADGGEYNGDWKEDVRDGYGVYTSPRGKKEAGNWKNNKLVTVRAGGRRGGPVPYMAGWDECQPSVPGRGLPQFGAPR
jgi:hypothetical protein